MNDKRQRLQGTDQVEALVEREAALAAKAAPGARIGAVARPALGPASMRRVLRSHEGARRDVAESLHRFVQSGLLVASQRLQQVAADLAPERADTARQVSDIAADLDRLNESALREAARRLHPSIIQIGLKPALRSLLDASQLDWDLTAPGDDADRGSIAQLGLEPELRLAVYRFVEIAVVEARERAGAGWLTVALSSEDLETAVVTVRHDGVAVDTDVRQRSPGLLLMEDYCSARNGAMWIASRADDTRLVGAFPIVWGARPVASGKPPRPPVSPRSR